MSATRSSRMLLAAAALALLAGRAGAQAQPPDAPPPSDARLSPIVRIVQQAGPAVVNVFLADASGAHAPRSSLGSGLLIDADGYILTNAHLLPLGSGGLHVGLSGGGEFPASLVNVDLEHDVALLKITPAPGVRLPAVRLGTSSDLIVGETVIAIGNPQGREPSVTSGIVSALSRSLRGQGHSHAQGAPNAFARPSKDLIQIGAPLPAGSSGGPLLNVEGEVIGLLLAIGNPAQGLGLAIPVDRVRRSLTGQLLNPRLLSEVETGFELAGGPAGRDVSLARLTPGGPAECAGLRAGDRLLGVRGAPIAWEFDVAKALLASQPGERVPLLVARGDERLCVELLLERSESPLVQVWRRVGVQIVDHNRFKGVRVSRVDPTGPAADLGLQAGDLIDGLGERLLDTTGDLFQSVRALPGGTQVVVHVWRGQQAWSGPLILR